jgi:hypothetical protein
MAAPVIANVVLKPNRPEFSEQDKDKLLGADLVRVRINAFDVPASEYAPATLEFLLRNASLIYGVVDCCTDVSSDWWGSFMDTVAFPALETDRWTVRILANEPHSWEERIELHSPKGLFCLTSPIYVEDTAEA